MTAVVAKDIAFRYYEQLATTVETMRRRGLAVYDFGISLKEKGEKAVSEIRGNIEPACLDGYDHFVKAVNDLDPLNPNDRETRNTILELYLGISVLMIGLSAGELCGVSLIGYLLGTIFDPFLEFLLLVLSPIYVLLIFRKKSLDDSERRVNLFALALLFGSVTGHLIGERMVRLVPSTFFIQPLIFGLLTDSEFPISSVYSDRIRLLSTASALGVVVETVISSYAIGSLTLSAILMSLAHTGVLFVHFQGVIAVLKTRNQLAMSETQMIYVAALLVAQIIVSLTSAAPELAAVATAKAQ